MTIRSQTNLITYISGVIPDNNAGQISAADVRSSIVDTVESINYIVGSGDFDTVTPFLKNVRVKIQGNDTGRLIVESGITFANGGGTQYVPYPGPQSIQHNQLTDLGIGDPHYQYILTSGTRAFSGNVGFRNNWLNSSGNSTLETTNGKGIQFNYVSPTQENINVGSGTQFTFLNDKSVLNSSRGMAKAWIRFQSSGVGTNGTPVVLDAYNVSGIKRQGVGQFTIIFNSGVFKDNNYVAIGHSNGRSLATSLTDFTENNVYMSYRVGDDGTKLRSISYAIIAEDGTYLESIVNDLVVFGTEPGGSGITTVSINPNYTA